MSLYTMSFAGGSLILLGSYESFTSPFSKTHSFNPITLLSTAFISLLFIINSLISLISSDYMGPTLQLQVISVSALFLLFSLLGLLTVFSKSLPSFPYSIFSLLLLFAFVEEFLLFYIQLKDVDGIENRYYDLMLVPVAICVFCTMIELKDGGFGFYPRLGRGLGLVLQGMWFVQMGFSFYSDWIANNCDLVRRSRGNFTIKCKSHMDTHRGGAIAVLLFNCHLALLVAVVCGVYGVVGKRFMVAGGDYSNYQPVEERGKFTLDSDEEEEGGGGGGGDGIKVESGSTEARRGNGGSMELVVNGYSAHP